LDKEKEETKSIKEQHLSFNKFNSSPNLNGLKNEDNVQNDTERNIRFNLLVDQNEEKEAETLGQSSNEIRSISSNKSDLNYRFNREINLIKESLYQLDMRFIDYSSNKDKENKELQNSSSSCIVKNKFSEARYGPCYR